MNIHHEKQISNIAYEISEKVLNGKLDKSALQVLLKVGKQLSLKN